MLSDWEEDVFQIYTATEPKLSSDQVNQKLENKVAIIVGGESVSGREIAVAFAREGADIVIAYQNNYDEAELTSCLIQDEGRDCVLMAGDVSDEFFCQLVAEQTFAMFNRIDILVNNVDEQHLQECIENISSKQLEHTFATNFFSMFYMTKAVLHYLKPGSTIINTASEAAYHGEPNLLDYSATKGAVVSFTRSLARSVIDRDVRVNGVATGSLCLSDCLTNRFCSETDNDDKKGDFLIKRITEPKDIAPAYVFLASADSSHMTGEILHPSGR
jgi:NAD(P)-dependent dehydrogenase (short-subunit alcohol dehydrogenase family)